MAEWHVITGEYPPQPGGVSDYTRLVASGLAAAGDTVHIWCPEWNDSNSRRAEEQREGASEEQGVKIHRKLGAMSPQDLLKAGRMLDEFPGPRRILVQWVPHAFGFRSANVPMSFWIWNRALTHKDDIEVMIHEPYLPMRQSRLKHSALALAHRVMLMAVLRRASRVWTSIPKWEEYCRPYTLGRSIPFAWLPVVSNIPVAGEEQCRASAAIRARYAPAQGNLIGHFGTCGGAIGDALSEIVPSLLNHCPERTLLLIGRDSGEARERLVRDCPQLRNRIYPTGSLSSAEVSAHISACDVMVQPYPDGVSSRRGSLMAPLSHGRPIVATSGRLTEPLWHDAAAAVLVPAGAHQQMAAAVEDLLVDKNKRDRLSAAAKTMYEQHFALNRVIGRLRNEVSA